MTVYLMIARGSSNACGREVISGPEAQKYAQACSYSGTRHSRPALSMIGPPVNTQIVATVIAMTNRATNVAHSHSPFDRMKSPELEDGKPGSSRPAESPIQTV